jgi:hypothetical protein
MTLAVGCATAPVYGPLGAKSMYGYRDRPNADGSHTILVVGLSADQAREFWDRRAQELCGGSEYRKNLFRAQRSVVQASGYAANAYNPAYGASYTYDTYGAFELEGYLTCRDAAETPVAPASEPTNEPVSEPASARAAAEPATVEPQAATPPAATDPR